MSGDHFTVVFALDAGAAKAHGARMNPVVKFLNRMDATAWRAVIVTSLLLAGLVAIFLFGRLVLLNDDGPGLLARAEDFLTGLRSSPFGLLAVIVFFCVMAFLGAPQFGLIGVVVLAFGPVLGFFYSWFAALCSGSLTFWIGRWTGMTMIRRYGGQSIQRMSRFMGRNAFAASAIVRNVPTGPFVVVNMAFGASEAKYLHYIAGMAVGVIPKTLLTALFGQAVAASLAGNPMFAVFAVIAMGVIWIALMLFARSRMAKSPEDVPADATKSD